MSDPPRTEESGARPAPEENDPEVVAVLEGRDSIEIDEVLVEEPVPPERKESLYTSVRRMSVAERLKLAMTGNKEARQILARDPAKIIQTHVLKNPRFTLEEALAMAKNRSLHGDLLRMIADEREWVRQYAVRLALVQNPKTPLQVALTLLTGIRDRDMRQLARSKNVPSVLQQQARRNILRKDSSSGPSGSKG